MIRILYLTKELRALLKKPLDQLISETEDSAITKIKKKIRDESPVMLISVGDVVSERLFKGGSTPNLMIIDNRVMRRSIRPIDVKADKVFRVKNPPGTITEEAEKAIRDAIKDYGIKKIDVDGEEDLLALIAIREAPFGSLVVYGQPGEGVVAVKVTKEKKDFVENMLSKMVRGEAKD